MINVAAYCCIGNAVSVMQDVQVKVRSGMPEVLACHRNRAPFPFADEETAARAKCRHPAWAGAQTFKIAPPTFRLRLGLLGCTRPLDAAGILQTRAAQRWEQLSRPHLPLHTSGAGRFAAATRARPRPVNDSNST